jgi:hypothetical protein
MQSEWRKPAPSAALSAVQVQVQALALPLLAVGTPYDLYEDE